MATAQCLCARSTPGLHMHDALQDGDRSQLQDDGLYQYCSQFDNTVACRGGACHSAILFEGEEQLAL